MEKTADLEPLEDRRSLKILTQCEKIRRLPTHPLHGELLAVIKSQLHLANELHQPLEDIIPEYDVPTTRLKTWTQIAG
jgi:hypothetical protein